MKISLKFVPFFGVLLMLQLSVAAQVGLNVVSGSSVSNTNGAGGLLAVGSTTGNYIAVDGDDIQRRSGSNYGTLYLNYYGGTINLAYGSDGESSSVIMGGRSTNAGSLVAYRTLYVNGSSRKVGIGTSIPDDQLHVVGVDNNGTNATLRVQSGTQEMLIDGNEIDTSVDMYLNNNKDSGVYIARGGGQVGVGTDDVPSGYRFAVDGNMIAERVRVRLSQNWPDYVFQEDYPLLPLVDLQQNISKNGHLPNIPDAATMAEEGQDLGEMQVKMMEKIEELTLYILQLHERIAVLETDRQ